MSNKTIQFPTKKGFRSPPEPTKGEVLKENQNLAMQLQMRLENLQRAHGSLLQRALENTRAHEQELNQLSLWLGSAATTEGAQAGDHLILDYMGQTLDDEGNPEMLTIKDAEGRDVAVPNYFTGGSGKTFMLTNLVAGKTLIAGFEEQLVGLKAGEGKEVLVQFPADYGAKDLQNKKAKFTVFVHVVQRSWANSPVGDLIDEQHRIKTEYQARLRAEAEEKAKAAAEAAKAAATQSDEPLAATAEQTRAEAAEEAAPAEAQTPTQEA